MHGPLLFTSGIDSNGDGGSVGDDAASDDLGSLTSWFERNLVIACHRPLPAAAGLPIIKGGLIRNVRLLLARVSGSFFLELVVNKFLCLLYSIIGS